MSHEAIEGRRRATHPLPALGWWRFGLNPIVAFWCAYVLTRPLGASIADWLGKPSSFGGGLVTLAGLALFVVLVAFVAITRHDVPATRRRDRI